MPADLYDVLGIPDDASAEEIKGAYRQRVREYHPDVNDHPDGDAQFKLVRTANDVLADPAERKTYDRLGHREYVDQHLEALPPVSVFPDEDLPDGSSTRDDASGGDASTTTGSSSKPDGSTAHSAASARASQSTNTGSETSANTRTDDGTASTSDTWTGDSEAETSTTDGHSTSAGPDRSSWDRATNSTQTTASESTVPAGVRRRRGLKRWYGVVVLSLLLYLGGLGLYALPRQSALQTFADDVAVDPVLALFGTYPLSSPTTYLLDAARAGMAGTPDLGLVLLAGTALLPLVVLTTVGRFGRGLAWMYALPSIAPAVCFAAWRFVTIPTWIALLGLIVLPILSGGGFLVDVGRYLRATR